MLAIACDLMAQPKPLLLDEPLLGLASQLVSSLVKTLARLRDEDMTILDDFVASQSITLGRPNRNSVLR